MHSTTVQGKMRPTGLWQESRSVSGGKNVSLRFFRPRIGATVRGIDEDQCGVRKNRSCLCQIFVARQLPKKINEKNYEVFLGFMDLHKAYGKVDRDNM